MGITGWVWIRFREKENGALWHCFLPQSLMNYARAPFSPSETRHFTCRHIFFFASTSLFHSPQGIDPTAQGQPQLLSIEQFTKCGLGARHLSPLFIYSSQWLYQSSVRPEPPDPSGALPSTSLCLFLQRILSEERACWFGVSLKYCFIELGALLTQLTKIYLWCGSVSTQHSSLKEVKNWRKGLNLWS